ncbi:MAG TPA: NAD kinase [Prevotella sp.]
MTSRKLKFAVFGNECQTKKSVSIQKIFTLLADKGGELYIDRPFYDYLTNVQGIEIKASGVFEDYNFDVDYVISLGGDGTFLRAASKVGAKGTPILGINMGRLGFLADVLPAEAEEAIDAIFSGQFEIEKHGVIQMEAEGEPVEGCPYALNDIAVLKRDNASMISIRICIDNEYLVTYQADGLIVSTPTGSTAYSLSNGGPIMVPQSGILCLTPVAPHSLNIRPIVISDKAVITLTVASRSHNFLAAVDGRSEKLLESTKVTIRRAPYDVNIVKRPNQRYYATLREKMMWGADTRE